jgi:hypothetical protein
MSDWSVKFYSDAGGESPVETPKKELKLAKKYLADFLAQVSDDRSI